MRKTRSAESLSAAVALFGRLIVSVPVVMAAVAIVPSAPSCEVTSAASFAAVTLPSLIFAVMTALLASCVEPTAPFEIIPLVIPPVFTWSWLAPSIPMDELSILIASPFEEMSMAGVMFPVASECSSALIVLPTFVRPLPTRTPVSYTHLTLPTKRIV